MDEAIAFLPRVVRERVASEAPLTLPERTRFDAALAFVDISGFSRLSEMLQKRYGMEGAELLQVVDWHVTRA